MAFNLKNKKAISELISFSFITLIIIIAASSAFIYSKSLIDENVNTLDRNRMEGYLKSLDAKITHISVFDNASTTQEITFRKGLLSFNNNQVLYQSLVPFSENTTSCFGVICYQGVGGSESLQLNLTSPYVFLSNISLEPGTYILIMEHNKNAQKIEITFK